MPESPLGAISLTPLDWMAVGLYVLATLVMVAWTYLRQRDTSEDYFLAGRSQGWLIVSITVFATLFSSISFVAIPGEAFANGLLMSLILLLMPLTAPLAVWLFLRFFFLAPTYTAYEYLERRFNTPTRIIGALLFCITRLIYAGVVFYAAATLFESLVGWSALVTIVTIGLFTVLYTTTGGMKAVIATDVLQAVVLIGGVGAMLFQVLNVTGFNPLEIYQFAAEHGRGYEAAASSTFFHLNFYNRLDFWLLAWIVITTPMMSLSADQLVVQRLLTSKGYRGAKRAVLFNYWMSVPLVFMFWAVGIGLFYYYGKFPEKLPDSVSADHVVGFFIGTELPPPVPGLIVAALLAALMSTISSVVNSIATVVYRDGLVRLGVVKSEGPHEMRICKVLSVLAGFAAIGMALALVVGGEGIKSTVFEVNAVWGQLGAILMAAFLLGVLAPRVSGPAMLLGLLAGSAIGLAMPYLLYYNVPADERISFYWIGVPAVLTALIVPLLLSVVWPNRKDRRDLTLWTLSGDEPFD